MARDVLAGAAAMYATPFYHNIGTGTNFQLVWPSLILAIIGIIVAIPVYVFVQHGSVETLSISCWQMECFEGASIDARVISEQHLLPRSLALCPNARRRAAHQPRVQPGQEAERFRSAR